MTYSCSDFTDDIVAELIRLGLIEQEAVPDDDPSLQADLALAAIGRLVDARKTLAATASTLTGALQSCMEQIQQMQGMFDDNDGAIAQSLEDGEKAMEEFRRFGAVRGPEVTRANSNEEAGVAAQLIKERIRSTSQG